jgi:D-glycero-D-manno-heptose 1,7-bisphosphate phosphatase
MAGGEEKSSSAGITPMLDLQRMDAVIFDRDGVLIEDLGFVHRPDQVRWIDGALVLLRELKEQGVLAMVATNQSGVARGYFGVDAVEQIHLRLARDAEAAGGKIEAFEYCPHLPNGVIAPYNIECECRKPKPGMIHKLLARFGLNPEKVILIGDRERDVEAALAAGVVGHYFPGGSLLDFCRSAFK